MSEYIRDEQATRAERDARRKDRAREDMDMRAREMPDRAENRDELESMARLADVVNDPSIQVDAEMMRAINDPRMVMTSNGDLARLTGRSNQFRRDLILPDLKPKRKKRGKKNPKLARAFKEANRRMRTKSGKLRKGRSQADIARLAHRLMKKM